jgi:hypothetical protein
MKNWTMGVHDGNEQFSRERIIQFVLLAIMVQHLAVAVETVSNGHVT